MSNNLREKQNDILRRLSELTGSEATGLIKEYCTLEYEQCKEKLVREEDPVMRGKAQMCARLVKDFTFD